MTHRAAVTVTSVFVHANHVWKEHSYLLMELYFADISHVLDTVTALRI